MYEKIITMVLATAPSLPTDRAPPSFDVADIDVETSDASTSLIAYGSDGEVAAEIVVWIDSDNRRRLDANFADGLYLTAVRDGGQVSVESNDSAEVADRVAVLETVLPQVTEQEVMECALGIIGLAGGCGFGGALGCMGGAAGFAMTCGKTLVEELQDEGEDPNQGEDQDE